MKVATAVIVIIIHFEGSHEKVVEHNLQLALAAVGILFAVDIQFFAAQLNAHLRFLVAA